MLAANARRACAPLCAPDHRTMPPAISILLPALDAATTLDACLRSIVRQRERDWECVLVDDEGYVWVPGVPLSGDTA